MPYSIRQGFFVHWKMPLIASLGFIGTHITIIRYVVQIEHKQSSQMFQQICLHNRFLMSISSLNVICIFEKILHISLESHVYQEIIKSMTYISKRISFRAIYFHYTLEKIFPMDDMTPYCLQIDSIQHISFYPSTKYVEESSYVILDPSVWDMKRHWTKF